MTTRLNLHLTHSTFQLRGSFRFGGEFALLQNFRVN